MVATNHNIANDLRLVFWETTAGCNLECVHCRRIDVAKELMRNDLSTAESLKFVENLAAFAKPILVLSGGVAPAMAHGGVIHAREGARIVDGSGLGDVDAPVTQLIDAPALDDYSSFTRRSLANYPPAGGVVVHDVQAPEVNYIPQMLNSTGLGGMTTRDIPEGGYKETDINQLYDLLPNRGAIGHATIDRELGRQPTLETTPMSDQTDQPEDKPFAPGTIGGLTAPRLPALNPGPEASNLTMSALQDRGPPQEHRDINETPYKLSQFAGGSPFTDDQIQQMLRTGEMIDPAKLPAGSRLPTGAGPNAGGGGGNAGLRAGVGTANIGQGAGLGVGPQAGQAAPVVGNAGLRAGAGTQNAGTTQAPSFSDRFRTAMNDPLTMLGMHLMAGQSRNPLTNLGTAMAGTQQQVEAQAMRQAQARLAMAKEAATEEYQRGRLENSANRTDIYGERVRDQAAATQAHASQVMAMAALRGSQNPKNDAFNELLGTVNPTTGQKYTRAEAYGVISGLEQRQNIANTTHEDRVAALQNSDAYRNGQLALKNAGMNDANTRAIMHDAVQLSAALGKPLAETLNSVASNYGLARNAAMPAAPAQGGPPLSGLGAILD